MPEQITSPANPRIKAIAGLRRRRARDQERRTVVEGFEELSLALDSGVVPELLLLCPDLFGQEERSPAQRLHARARDLGTEVVLASRSAFEKAAYREGPDGVLAVVRTVGSGCAEVLPHLPNDALVLLCEGVEKPGNLGAMLRTADAAGVAAVLAADPVTDWGNPNTVRASKGTVFCVPVTSDSTAATLDALESRGIPVLATTPDTETAHTDVDYRGPVAIAVGAEKTGLSDQVLERAAQRVRIPMVGRANSLNVATSAAIVVYEAVRQRRAGQ